MTESYIHRAMFENFTTAMFEQIGAVGVALIVAFGLFLKFLKDTRQLKATNGNGAGTALPNNLHSAVVNATLMDHVIQQLSGIQQAITILSTEVRMTRETLATIEANRHRELVDAIKQVDEKVNDLGGYRS